MSAKIKASPEQLQHETCSISSNAYLKNTGCTCKPLFAFTGIDNGFKTTRNKVTSSFAKELKSAHKSPLTPKHKNLWLEWGRMNI